MNVSPSPAGLPSHCPCPNCAGAQLPLLHASSRYNTTHVLRYVIVKCSFYMRLQHSGEEVLTPTLATVCCRVPCAMLRTFTRVKQTGLWVQSTNCLMCLPRNITGPTVRSSLCCVGVRTPKHVIGNCSVTQTAAAKKPNRVQFQAPDKSAMKLMTAAGCKVLL